MVQEILDQALCDAVHLLVTSPVDLSMNRINNRGALSFANHQCTKTTIQALHLSTCYNQFGNESIVVVACVRMHKNSTLVYLNLSTNCICTTATSSIECFLTLICKCDILKCILLNETGLLDGHFQIFALPNVQLALRLEVVDLNRNAIGDTGVALLAPAVAASMTIRLLGLSNCKTTDAGAQSFSVTLSKSNLCEQLDNICISGNLITSTFSDYYPVQ